MTPGLHYNISHAAYHERRLGLVSKSALDLVHRSPLHYKNWVEGQDEEQTPALFFGSAFHCALLEPERYAATYAVEPDFGDCRFKANKQDRDDWRAANGHKTPIPEDMGDNIAAMVEAVRKHPLAGRIINGGKSEVTARWIDEATGLECKCRADYFVEKKAMVADVKSTLDARRDAFRKDVAKYTYHWQDALYREGFKAAGAEVRHFVFIAVEKVKPHALAIYALDPEAVIHGATSVRSTINTLAECVKSGKFPGYSESIQSIDTPPWAA